MTRDPLRALAALLLLVGCGDDARTPAEPDAAPEVAADGGPDAADAEADAGPSGADTHCGVADYTLLPPLGEPLAWEALPLFDLDAAAISALIEATGVAALPPSPYGTRLFRFRYTTQDRGAPVEATGLIGVPAHLDAEPAEPWPLVLLLHGFAGATDACAPSGDDLIGPAVPALLTAQGFVVVAPDYIGMNGFGAPAAAPHAPLVGEQLGVGAWDALRAGRALLGGELAGEVRGALRDDVVVWGASQGGHGAFFVELYRPYYAAETTVRGVVAAAPAHSLMAVMVHGLETFGVPTSLSALALVGMRRWYGAPDGLGEVLTNEAPYFIADNVEAVLTSGGETCAVEAEIEVDAVEDVFVAGFVAAMKAGDRAAYPPWSCYVAENSVSLSSLPRLGQTPLLVVYGELDPLVIAAHQRADFDRLCAQGWQLQHLECAAAPHAESTLWSLPEQLAWLRARLAGAPLDADVCVRGAPVCCSASPADRCTP